MKSEKIAVVTGGNRGLGFEVCRQLGQQGTRVYLTSRSEDEGQDAVNKLRNEGFKIHFYQMDVTDQDSVNRFASYFLHLTDKLDILINSAAIYYDLGHRMEEPDLDNALEAFKTNTLGPWRVSAAFLPALKKSEHPRIVNVSSGSGSFANMRSDTPVYSMSKAALNVLTIKMALSWRKYGVKVNAVCPGWVRTEMGGRNAPRSPEEGAQCILWAANIPDDGPTGGFFRDGNAISW